MKAAARAQRLSEGVSSSKLLLVQASLGPVQEDRSPPGGSRHQGGTNEPSCFVGDSLPGSLLQGGNTCRRAAVGQPHTKVHDYKPFIIRYGIRTSGVSESILTQHRQATVFSLPSLTSAPEQ